MKIRNRLFSLVCAISVSSCSVLPNNEQVKANSASVINFKQDSENGTKVAQLMCFKRHLAVYTERPRIIPPAQHDIFIRIVDYSYMNPAERNRTQWGGVVRKGNVVMLQAKLTAGQTVMVQRRDMDGKSFVWLQDSVTGKAISETKFTILLNPFGIDSDFLDKKCAKGTV